MPQAGWWKRLASGSFLANGLAIFGGIYYLFQSWGYAHSQTSVLDEGAYLVKGYLFAIGQYWPYQDYGFWSNHMPLGFLIPGYVQAIFGPGLRTGRIFAVILGGLLLVGLWITVRRFGGKWWAAAAIWAMALNIALIKIYSMAISEVLVACMLVWILALTLGEARPVWQILLGSVLAGAMALTRLNLVPVLPFFAAYIFWQHGRRVGVWATLLSFGVLLIGHAIYWPGIMRLWATWIPTDFLPYLARFRPPEATPLWDPPINWENRLLSFFMAIRFHFAGTVGVLVTLLLWPKRQDWKSESHFRACVFLVILFGLLFFLHAWASIGLNPQSHDAMGKNYCVFCFPLYLGFFSFVGLILVAASASSWRLQMRGWLQPLVIALILIISTGIGFAAFDELDDQLLPVLETRVPQVDGLRVLPDQVRLKKVLRERSGLTHKEFDQVSRRVLPASAGFLFGVGVLILTSILVFINWRIGWWKGVSFAPLVLMTFLAVGTLFSRTLFFGGGYHNYDCSGDVLKSYEKVGKQLSDLIPPGSTIYWNGGNSAVPLLYLKDIQIFAPQINSDYTFRLDGDPNKLFRYGFWNEQLAYHWADEADFILIEERRFSSWLENLADENGFHKVAETAPALPCRDDSNILVFQRK